jgi:tRNA (mo5U34)-methyltransferase
MSPEAGTRPSAEEARAAIARNPVWYHSIEVAPGVVTPGRMDLRAVARRVLPPDLRGLRALDVGTFDGFWAFELERRGAREVVALDLERVDAAEWPPLRREALAARAEEWEIELGRGFRIAAELLGSSVRRVERSVYELDADAVGGPVDLVFVGSMLLHLRDPVRGLERVHDVLVPGGRLIVQEPISLRDTLRAPRSPLASFQAHGTEFNWWYPNAAALRAWLEAARFEDVRRVGVDRPPSERAMRQWHLTLAARRGAATPALDR